MKRTEGEKRAPAMNMLATESACGRVGYWSKAWSRPRAAAQERAGAMHLRLDVLPDESDPKAKLEEEGVGERSRDPYSQAFHSHSIGQ